MRFAKLFAAGILLLAPLAVKAQDLATIVGTVMDASGGVVPDVDVTVTNADRGFSRKVVTDSIGAYSVSRIPTGNYTIVAEKGGFQKLVQNGVTLDVGQTLRADLYLHVGSATQEVVVSANTIAVETETGAISHVVTSSQVSELNLEARNFANLATLIPGAAPLGTGFDPSSVGRAGQRHDFLQRRSGKLQQLGN